MNKTILISILLVLNSSCMVDEAVKIADASADGYKTVKNANSIGKVADSINVLADTQKIKAETNKDFLKKTESLIAKQPVDNQNKLIQQSIAAKVQMSKNSRYVGWVEGFLLCLLILLFGKAIRYTLNWYRPLPTSQTTNY